MTESKHNKSTEIDSDDGAHIEVCLRILANKLISKLSEAVDSITETDLITDRQALRNITGALKDLRDICTVRESHSKSADEPTPTLTVAFLGDAENMAE